MTSQPKPAPAAALGAARRRLQAGGAMVEPQGMLWRVREPHAGDATILRADEVIALAQTYPAAADESQPGGDGGGGGEVAYGPTTLLIRSIRRDGGTQARVGLNEDVVQEYAEAMRDRRWDWRTIKRPLVYHDDGASGDYWLADGFHRIEAAQRAGLTDYPVEVLRGDKRAAQLHAARANADHGLRRSRQDVQRAIELLLRDEEWARWSDREIARHVHCSPTTVGAVRKQIEATVQFGQSTYRQGADGRVTNTAGITAANQARAADKVPALSQDEDDRHIAAAHKCLADAAGVGERTGRGLYQEAYSHARQVSDTERRQALFTEIDRAVDGTVKSAAAPTPTTITITTDKGPREIVPTRRIGDLAMHPSVKNPPDPHTAWSITYVPMGGLIGSGWPDQQQAEAVLEDLATLDWSVVTNGVTPPALAAQAREILARYGAVPLVAPAPDPSLCNRCGKPATGGGAMTVDSKSLCPNCAGVYLQETAAAQALEARQAPHPAVLPAVPTDRRAAATAWVTEIRTILARSPEYVMFRRDQIEAAVVHIEALLQGAPEDEHGPVPTLAALTEAVPELAEVGA